MNERASVLALKTETAGALQAASRSKQLPNFWVLTVELQN